MYIRLMYIRLTNIMKENNFAITQIPYSKYLKLIYSMDTAMANIFDYDNYFVFDTRIEQ